MVFCLRSIFLAALCAICVSSQNTNTASTCNQQPIVQNFYGMGDSDLVGPPGPSGPPGQKGAKGDGGHAANYTRKELHQLRQENQEQQTVIRNLISQLDAFNRTIQAFKSSLSCSALAGEPGWFVAGDPGNCYQYQRTSTEQSWQASRRICQVKGGDLAHIGIRNLNVRSLVINATLGARGLDAWIGLSDRQTEGKFIYLDGVASTVQNTRFQDGQPDNYQGNEDCVNLNWVDHPHNTANDWPCWGSAFGLCEKPL